MTIPPHEAEYQPDDPAIPEKPEALEQKKTPGKKTPLKKGRVELADMWLLFAAPPLAVLLLESFSRGNMGFALSWAVGNPPAFLVNTGVVACVFWLFAFFRGRRTRAGLSIVFVMLLCVIGIINFNKIRFRFEPVLLTDLWQLGELGNTLTLPYRLELTGLIPVLGLGALALTLSLVFIRRARPARNVICPVISLVLFYCLLPACTFQSGLVEFQTDLVNYAKAGGSLYNVIAMEQRRQADLHARYSENEILEGYERARGLAQSDESDTPNVILILSESFTDEVHLGRYLDLTEPLTPFYRELTQTCRAGEMYVPKMGGGTSETEFEVLTGLKSDSTMAPYSMGVPGLHSMAAVLRERGYTATVLHWYAGVYYNRYKNLQKLGFDTFFTTDTTTREFGRVGPFISDAEHYRAIMETLRRTDTKDFVFCITMQNHGPYGGADYAGERRVPFSNVLSEENERIARNFCYLLQRSDAALRDFIAGLSRFEEPTVVVFFGDHIPGFGLDFYTDLGMPMEGGPAHQVPYFIWSNVQNEAKRVDLKAWQMGAYALSVAGVRSDPFFNYIETLRESGENEDATYGILSHDALLGAQKVYRREGFRMESPRWTIGGPMELLGFETQEVDGAVYVLPILRDGEQAFKLAVNGQALEDWKVLLTNRRFTLQCVMVNSNGTRFNQSEAVSFANTRELLQKTRRPRSVTLDLGQLGYHVAREERGYFVAQTDVKLKGHPSCLTLDGKRAAWQQPYGFRGAGEYHLAPTYGPVSVTIRYADFEGYERTSEGIAAYFKAHQAKLTRFLPSGEMREEGR